MIARSMGEAFREWQRLAPREARRALIHMAYGALARTDLFHREAYETAMATMVTAYGFSARSAVMIVRALLDDLQSMEEGD